jgi:hypothetical protein
MNYDAEFCQQIRVSEAEKRPSFALISEILALAIKGRNFGLLSLGKEAEESSSFLLGKGLQLALDGVKSNTARTILELYIHTGNYTGKELLERCIILEGVLGILDGMHPKLLKELLLSFLGETGHAIFKAEFETGGKEKQLSYLKEIEKKPAATNSAAKLGNFIAKLDEKAIKRFLQIIHIDDLAKTVKDMDGKAQIKIFNYLPDRGASMLFEAIEQMDSIANHEIVEAQQKFVAIMSELKDEGRI